METLTVAAGVALGVVMAAGLLQFLHHGFGRDDSDPPKGRSGLVIYTDAKTGVQYVSSVFGMTVRVDVDGKPIRAKEDKQP